MIEDKGEVLRAPPSWRYQAETMLADTFMRQNPYPAMIDILLVLGWLPPGTFAALQAEIEQERDRRKRAEAVAARRKRKRP